MESWELDFPGEGEGKGSRAGQDTLLVLQHSPLQMSALLHYIVLTHSELGIFVCLLGFSVSFFFF